MNIEEFTEVMRVAHLRKIEKTLKTAGFLDCRRSKTLRQASLYAIATAPYEATPCFPDGKKNEFVGNLCRNVKGFEEYTFLIVQQLSPCKRGCEDLSTKKMLIYAKAETPENK